MNLQVLEPVMSVDSDITLKAALNRFENLLDFAVVVVRRRREMRHSWYRFIVSDFRYFGIHIPSEQHSKALWEVLKLVPQRELPTIQVAEAGARQYLGVVLVLDGDEPVGLTRNPDVMRGSDAATRRTLEQESTTNTRDIERQRAHGYPASDRSEEDLEPGPPPRYACLRLFEEIEPWKPEKEFSAGQLLLKHAWCLAEISVTTTPVGVTPADRRRPIREPNQTAPVDIIVTAESNDCRIMPRVGKLVLPPNGNSTQNAFFRLLPLRASGGPDDLLRIRFRLFYRLNLLQVLTLRSGALSHGHADEIAQYAPPKPELVYHIQSDANDFDSMPPRALHISIDTNEQQYDLTFTFKPQGEGVEVAIPATVRLTADHLQSEIAGVRKSLFRISAAETLGRQVQGLGREYDEHLIELATRGSRLWSLLFDRGEGQEITLVGEALRQNPLPDGSVIQISVDPRAASFVFAWNMLYDHASTEEDGYSERGFWGLRYVIEQRLIIPTPPVRTLVDPCQIEIGAMYWKFSQTPSQQQYICELVKSAGEVTLSYGAPIDEARKARECLESCKCNILYFFAHGHTELPDGERYGVTVKDFVDLYEKLPERSTTRAAWKYVANAIAERQFRSDDSWIELTFGRLRLNDLYARIKFLPLRPVVILNMCDSAQITPSLSQSFIDFFLTRGARSVVGTECSIRPVFADFVGRALLASLLAAKPIGEALRQVRLEAVRRKNLLGLAYTLFGSADATLNARRAHLAAGLAREISFDSLFYSEENEIV